VDVQRSGRMAYRLRFTRDGVKRHVTLGDPRVITLEEVRHEARLRLRQFRHDVVSTDHLPGQHDLTVGTFFMEQYLPYVRTYKRSWVTDESMIRNHILPALGALGLAAVRTPDISSLVEAMRSNGYAPGTTNRMLVLLRYGYKLAMRWKVGA